LAVFLGLMPEVYINVRRFGQAFAERVADLLPTGEVPKFND
jgi:hypothetical protein